jgi:hypothetical protein
MTTLSSSIGIIGAPVSHLLLIQWQRKKTGVVDVCTMQNGVTEYSTAEGCGLTGVQRCMRSLYNEVIYISAIRGWVRHFKNGGNEIADRYHSDLPVTAATTVAEDEV